MSVAAAPNAGTHLGFVRQPIAMRRYGVRDLLTTLFYHWRIMLAAFLLPVVLGIAAAAHSKPVYVAQARLLVLYGSEYFYQPTAGQPGSGVALDRNEIMLGELQVLKSTSLAMQTLQAVGVDRVYPGTAPDDKQALEKAALRMGSDLSLSSLPQSNILELSFRNHDPTVARDVLRTLIANYLAYHATIFQRPPSTKAATDEANFLARLRAAEDALSTFAAAHGIANLDQQVILLLQQQFANSQAGFEVTQQISEATAKLDEIRTQLQRLPATIQSSADSERSQQMQLLTDSLLHLQAKRRDLASRFNESYPDIQSLDRQIQSVQAQIANTPSRDNAGTRETPNPIYQDMLGQQLALQAQLKGLQAKAADLAASGAALGARMRDLNKSAEEYRDLRRTRDVLDESYRSFVKANETAQMADNLDSAQATNIRVVQAPEAAPASLNMRRILVVLGLVVGLVAAIAAMALMNALRRVFVTARDISVTLDLPVLAVVTKADRGGMLRA
jgi:uncharacterized protein involved in exopolysaccharide biosynthesis